LEKEIIAPYYGDILSDFTEDSEGNAASAVAQGASDIVTNEVDFYSSFIKESFGISSSQIEEELDQQDEAVAQAAYHNRNVIAVMRAAEKLFPSKVEKLLKKLPQAYCYLKNVNASKAVDEIVAPALSEGAALIISHSLGTVVTYKLLRENPSPLNHQYITLGSPLGIEAVKKSIRPPFIRPDQLSLWYNGGDKDDFVAAGKKLSSCGYENVDEENFDIDNGKDDPHAISRYMSSDWVVNKVVELLDL